MFRILDYNLTKVEIMKTITKTPIIQQTTKKTNTYLIKVFVQDEYYTDCEYAIFTINRNLREKYKSIAVILNMISQRHTDLYSFSFNWYDNVKFINTSLHEELGIEETLENTEEEIIPIKNLSKKDFDKISELEDVDEFFQYINPECQKLNVYPDGDIMIDCFLKNSPIKLETIIIDAKYFE